VHLEAASKILVQEPEPSQHQLLTDAWLLLETGDPVGAKASLDEARAVFPHPSRVGDHTPHLLARLSRRIWAVPGALDAINEWRAKIHDDSLREQE
jgi:hypothetical protein